jgi:hypothetical protein
MIGVEGVATPLDDARTAVKMRDLNSLAERA